MSIIKIPQTIVPETCFLDTIPKAPEGRYAHIVLIRETESYPVFQTDGTLNIANVKRGVRQTIPLIRLAMFKRKQTSPERLTGRELLRRNGITQNQDDKLEPKYCDYNEHFCQSCPDCVYYGFAIGDAGAEKSKVYVDTAYSVSGYDESHQQFSFNALFEKGNMSQDGRVRSSFGEQDHIVLQVYFPSVITVKDVTSNSFAYVLNNLLRTKRYGAQTTRTGRLANHVVGIVFADGEIFSNLKLTQAIYDELSEKEQLEIIPLEQKDVIANAKAAIPQLLSKDGVIFNYIEGTELDELINCVTSVTTDADKLQKFLEEANAETSDYSERVIQG
ncbi:type I-D CRISPR-associated protein Cas7/Csc2 [Candidatus Poribacteria bacterium]|nr:type I-D CRISPR-associated protein Cas7/Csc2 [Candidatus Poribacteria bacterium]MYK24018.1 type I-D CRISPR-associated protein Cas7/Csc2 [Candidatus Poribacteria bacterium]